MIDMKLSREFPNGKITLVRVTREQLATALGYPKGSACAIKALNYDQDFGIMIEFPEGHDEGGCSMVEKSEERYLATIPEGGIIHDITVNGVRWSLKGGPDQWAETKKDGAQPGSLGVVTNDLNDPDRKRR